MGDMSAVIVAKSDQVNASDLLAGPITVTVDAVSVKPGTEQPVTMRLVGMDKVFRPCKGVCRVLAAVWGGDSARYVGKSMTLYHNAEVTWAGVKVGGIRISHMSDIESEKVLAIAESKKVIRPVKIKPLRVAAPVQPEAPDDTAARAWLAKHLAAIDAAADLPALDAIVSGAGKALAKMAAQFPALRDEAVQRANDRVAALSADGPDDSQRGDGFTDDADPFGLMPVRDDTDDAAQVQRDNILAGSVGA